MQDIIHAKPSRLPISSQELFSILDDASERTFLCAGTAESVQKYVFDGEAAKVVFELKNLVSCTCFLFELKLVLILLTGTSDTSFFFFFFNLVLVIRFPREFECVKFGKYGKYP